MDHELTPFDLLAMSLTTQPHVQVLIFGDGLPAALWMFRGDDGAEFKGRVPRWWFDLLSDSRRG